MEYLSWHTWDQAAPELETELPPETYKIVARAAAAAQRWHGDQQRPTGVPYLEHLLEALEVMVRGAGVRDPAVLAAVLLHDTVEDTAATISEIEAEFGPVVAEYIDWVTLPPARCRAEKRSNKVSYLRRLREAPPEAIWVKLADRVSNVQRLDQMPPDFQRRYYAETVIYLMPMTEGHDFFEPWYAAWSQRYAHLR